jgi:hypothetical protein
MNPKPTYYGLEVTCWMFLAVKLERPKPFAGLDRMAIQQSKSPLQTLDLPFGGHVIGRTLVLYSTYRASMTSGKARDSRETALSTLMDGMRALLNRLEQVNALCSDLCSAVMLGPLRHGLFMEGIMPAILEASPSTMYSFNHVYNDLRSISTIYCRTRRCSKLVHDGKECFARYQCLVQDVLKQILNNTEAWFQGKLYHL